MGIVLILAAASTLSGGCARFSMDTGYKGPPPLPEAIAHAFSRPRQANLEDISVIGETPAFILRRIRLERLPPGSGSIVADFHAVRGQAEKALIIVLPILGGNNTHANQFAAFLAENGFSGLVVHRAKDFKTGFDPDRVDDMTRTMVMDIRTVMDWIETRPGRAGRPMGILGISLGGLAAAMAVAVDSRFKAGILMLVGGDLPYILTHSRERRIREKRSAFMAAGNLTLEDFNSRMRETVTLDPLILAPYTDARNILLILAMFDQVVPISTGRALKAQMGNPETVYLFSGHYTAALYLSWARRASLEFFNRKLAPE